MSVNAFAYVNVFSIFGNGDLSSDDNRTPVSSTNGRNLAIAKLVITYENDAVRGGTGFLINNNTLVTAGHCMLLKDGNNVYEAKSIQMYFGVTGTNANHSYKYSRNIDENQISSHVFINSIFENTLKNEYSYVVENDYAYIKLPVALNLSKYFTLSNADLAENKSEIQIIGYENHFQDTKFSNWTLLKDSDYIKDVYDEFFTTLAHGMPGQSGSPVIDSNGNVVGIYTYGANEGSHIDLEIYPDANNFCTRVTQSMINLIE